MWQLVKFEEIEDARLAMPQISICHKVYVCVIRMSVYLYIYAVLSAHLGNLT